ncbi:TPA: hypothetical protein ACTDSP_002898 [Salmonella enterica subsp. enterica serovar Newport]
MTIDKQALRISELEELNELLREKIKKLESDLWDKEQLRQVYSEKSFDLECKVRELEARNQKDFVWRGKEISRLNDEVDELKEKLEAAEMQIVNLKQNCENDPRIHEIVDLKESVAELATENARIAEQREYYEGVIADGSKRIAELESNEVREVGNQFLVVRHPGKTPAIKHCTGDLEEFLRKLIEQDPLVTIDIITHRYYGVGGQWVQDAGEYLQMTQGAGIGVKQQEDSVDSDVGRNQPGMVVAVHIGAGDFVKVKGQVFEVEETDFDDHDVTLWFVGGNALKCAAGCQVEVVSAPVASGIKVKGSEHDRSTKR